MNDVNFIYRFIARVFLMLTQGQINYECFIREYQNKIIHLETLYQTNRIDDLTYRLCLLDMQTIKMFMEP